MITNKEKGKLPQTERKLPPKHGTLQYLLSPRAERNQAGTTITTPATARNRDIRKPLTTPQLVLDLDLTAAFASFGFVGLMSFLAWEL